LCQVLERPSLQRETEDWLFEFATSQFESKPSFLCLLDFVRFEYRTKPAIDAFIMWTLDHFGTFELTNSLWRAITRRLSATANNSLPSPRRYRKLRYSGTISPRDGFPLDGIIAHLARFYDGNVHERGVVNVSTSSAHSSGFDGRKAVEFDQQAYFQSGQPTNQWLCYDFKDRRIELTGYSIAAFPNYYLGSWVVEGSEDGSEWVALDERNNNDEANSGHPIATFTLDPGVPSRYIRLRQTGKAANDSDYLILFGFEVFGLITA
jgi:hypothetical protein